MYFVTPWLVAYFQGDAWPSEMLLVLQVLWFYLTRNMNSDILVVFPLASLTVRPTAVSTTVTWIRSNKEIMPRIDWITCNICDGYCCHRGLILPSGIIVDTGGYCLRWGLLTSGVIVDARGYSCHRGLLQISGVGGCCRYRVLLQLQGVITDIGGYWWCRGLSTGISLVIKITITCQKQIETLFIQERW